MTFFPHESADYCLFVSCKFDGCVRRSLPVAQTLASCTDPCQLHRSLPVAELSSSVVCTDYDFMEPVGRYSPKPQVGCSAKYTLLYTLYVNCNTQPQVREEKFALWVTSFVSLFFFFFFAGHAPLSLNHQRHVHLSTMHPRHTHPSCQKPDDAPIDIDPALSRLPLAALIKRRVKRPTSWEIDPHEHTLGLVEKEAAQCWAGHLAGVWGGAEGQQSWISAYNIMTPRFPYTLR